MSLTAKQKKLIVEINSNVKAILARYNNKETLLAEILKFMPGIQKLLDSGTKEELDMYAQEYEGFYYYMKVLENLAQGIASGAILVP